MSVERKWLVLIAIGASTFMTALDTSVVNTVLPVINRSLGSDIATIEWVVTVYLLIVSGLLLAFGRLGDMFSHKPIFLIGFAIFIISSALCGWAPKVELLITFRGFQAFGAAMLAANSPAILTMNFPPSQRGQALGLQATMTYLGLTAAPSLGGWLTDLLSWRAVFYINVPVGVIAFLLALLFIPKDKPQTEDRHFDFPGAAAYFIGLISLLVALNQGHVYGWTSIPIIGLFVIAGMIILSFLFIESRSKHPMLDLSLFSDRVFTSSTISSVLNYVSVFSVILLLPFYLIQGRNFTPSQAGLILTIQPVIMAIAAPISGSVSDRIGTRFPTILGMGTMAIGLVFLGRLGVNSSNYEVAIGLAVIGLGTGSFISPNNSAIMGSAPPQRQGIAAGIMATSRSTGMVLGVGLAGAIFTTILGTSPGGEAFYTAIRISFIFAAFIAVIGSFTSAIKG